jgi:hypothetical protein
VLQRVQWNSQAAPDAALTCMDQKLNTLPLVELVGTLLCRTSKKHSSLHVQASVKHGKTHIRKNTGMSR